jgi:monoamine oxidase
MGNIGSQMIPMSGNDPFRSGGDTLDTAIVGAGVGGLYTAWRLLGCGQPPGGVAVFEASARVGCRLFSVTMPGTTGIAADFGGMRFLSSHALFTSVAAKFGLGIREFPGAARRISPIPAASSGVPATSRRSNPSHTGCARMSFISIRSN